MSIFELHTKGVRRGREDVMVDAMYSAVVIAVILVVVAVVVVVVRAVPVAVGTSAVVSAVAVEVVVAVVVFKTWGISAGPLLKATWGHHLARGPNLNKQQFNPFKGLLI